MRNVVRDYCGERRDLFFLIFVSMKMFYFLKGISSGLTFFSHYSNGVLSLRYFFFLVYGLLSFFLSFVFFRNGGYFKERINFEGAVSFILSTMKRSGVVIGFESFLRINKNGKFREKLCVQWTVNLLIFLIKTSCNY